jgi:hypothetical protein
MSLCKIWKRNYKVGDSLSPCSKTLRPTTMVPFPTPTLGHSVQYVLSFSSSKMCSFCLIVSSYLSLQLLSHLHVLRKESRRFQCFHGFNLYTRVSLQNPRIPASCILAPSPTAPHGCKGILGGARGRGLPPQPPPMLSPN